MESFFKSFNGGLALLTSVLSNAIAPANSLTYEEDLQRWKPCNDLLTTSSSFDLDGLIYRLRIDDNDTVDDFAVNISGLPSKAASLGDNIEESKMVKKFLKGLPRQNYIKIIVPLASPRPKFYGF